MSGGGVASEVIDRVAAAVTDPLDARTLKRTLAMAEIFGHIIKVGDFWQRDAAQSDGGIKESRTDLGIFTVECDGSKDLRVHTPKKLLNLNDNFYWPMMKNENVHLIEGYNSC